MQWFCGREVAFANSYANHKVYSSPSCKVLPNPRFSDCSQMEDSCAITNTKTATATATTTISYSFSATVVKRDEHGVQKRDATEKALATFNNGATYSYGTSKGECGRNFKQQANQ